MAIEITRYVSPNGTGNGLTADSPTSDLGSVLKSSVQVDRLTIFAAPGYYHVAPHEGGYANVIFYGGCPDENTDTNEFTILDERNPGFGNSGIYHVKFTQNLGLGADCILKSCKIDGRLGIGLWTPGSTANISNCSMNEIDAEGRENNVLVLSNCQVNDSKGYGLSAKNIRVHATNVSFNSHALAGMDFDGGTAGIGSQFNHCSFNNNGKEGAVTIRAITNKIAVNFFRCEFIGNKTAQYDKASAMSAFSPIYASNCVFMDNETTLDSHSGAYHEAAVVTITPKSQFQNCTFVGNPNNAFSYNVYADEATPEYPQLENCVFFDNGNDIRTPYGAEPAMVKCATSEGTGIPELDAERGLIVLDEQTAGLENGRIVSPNSILINAGISSAFQDADFISHQMLGGTDIGAYEYSPLWTLPAKNAPVITCGKVDYVVATTEYQGHTYSALAPVFFLNDSTNLAEFNQYWLYLGEQPAPLKIVNDNLVAHYMNTPDGKKLAYISTFNLQDYKWDIYDYEYYTGAAPQARQVDGQWKLVAAAAKQPAKPTGSSAAKKPATSGSAKKPATRRSGPPIQPRK